MSGAAAVNYLEMSDEELMKHPMPTGSAASATDATLSADPVDPAPTEGEGTADPVDPTPVEGDGNTDPAPKEGDNADPAPADPVDPADPEGKDADPAPASAGKGTAADPSAATGTAQVAEAAADPEKKDGKDSKAADTSTAGAAVDYEAAYKKLTAPFKANGRDFQVENVDDAITLMQMGVNYNKKMAALKPNLKLLKLLEHNGLLNEEKISFLIDLTKKDPAAINKLVKDSGIDPMDLNADKASEYKQSTYTVDDREIDLDTVLDELKDSPAYTRTLEIVSTKWDSASKQVVAANPAILKVINDHVDRGIYDIISAQLERERTLGRLNGMSDIEAYKQIGDAINAKGGFNHLTPAAATAAVADQAKPAAAAVVTAPKPKVDEGKLKDKRRAASSTPPAASTAPAANEFNPLALSDEEFSKQVKSKFL